MPLSIRLAIALPLTLAAGLSATALPALASSDDAWAEFSKTVEAKCLEAAAGSLDAPKAVVDPFGSQSYGLAIVTGKAKGTDTVVTHLCAMDKQTEKAELGSELAPDMVGITVP